MNHGRVQIPADYQASERVLIVFKIDVTSIIWVIILKDVFSVVLQVTMGPNRVTRRKTVEDLIREVSSIGICQHARGMCILIPTLIQHVVRASLRIRVTIRHVLNFLNHFKHPAVYGPT